MHGGVTGSFFVGGQPEALLHASSAMYELASRTDDVANQVIDAVGSALTTVGTTGVFAPARAAAVAGALRDVLAAPHSGLASVAVAYHGVSLQLRQTGQALEAAGTVGLLARGGIRLLRGERPTVLASADGVDLRREAVSGSWSIGPGGQSGATAVREVRRPDGTTFFVVEATVGARYAESAGIQVNGAGVFAEVGAGPEAILRWAVPTERDAEMLVAAAAGAVGFGGGRLLKHLPKPTEGVLATTASVTAAGGPVPGVTASGTAAIRHEVTVLRSGGQRFSTSVSGSGQLALVGVAGTGGAGSARITVDRNPAGAVDRISLSTTTKVDRGRHGLPVLEAGNRESTLVERQWDVAVTPEACAAAGRIATATGNGDLPDRADVDALAEGLDGTAPTERTYDVRHQQVSFDVALPRVDGGAAAGIETATLRREARP